MIRGFSVVQRPVDITEIDGLPGTARDDHSAPSVSLDVVVTGFACHECGRSVHPATMVYVGQMNGPSAVFCSWSCLPMAADRWAMEEM